MADKFLHRDEAPFGDDVWEVLDETAIGAAKAQLSARKLLKIKGPFGLSLKSVPGSEVEAAESETADEVTIKVTSAIPVASIMTSFKLPKRDIASLVESGLPVNLKPVALAARACARQEDRLLFYGSDKLGVKGLLNYDGVLQQKLTQWKEVGTAVEQIINAVSKLDEAGYHGPYALALAPSLYNLLFRRYPQGNATELEHIKQLVTDGIVKAPALDSGGVLVATGTSYASIVLGQDLKLGFVGPENGAYEFSISETLALHVLVPSAICVLK